MAQGLFRGVKGTGMSHLRATIRLIALCAVTCGMYLLLIAGLAFTFPSRHARVIWRGIILRGWAKATAAFLKIRIAAYGAPPRAPFFLVSNHLSYVDIVVLASQFRCSFIAKKDISRWPVIGLLCQSIETIFINREDRRDIPRVNRQVERVLAEGRGVVLFAEGTSSEGATVLPFKPGLLESAARAGFAVSYAALSYRVPGDETPAYLSVCWWGDMTFIKHLFGLLRLREINATLIFGLDMIRDVDRKALASKLHAAVKQEFIPVVRSEREWITTIR
jgi:1-acyl-sn-glycerol-3-phosphate acyltransferase